jgi:integrase
MGERIHPDTLTRRFNRLVDRAGVPRIRLHDVRHTYATMAMDAGVNPKLLSDRIGHANELVTLQIYTHRTTGLDRPMAEQLSRMIEGAVRAASEAQEASS